MTTPSGTSSNRGGGLLAAFYDRRLRGAVTQIVVLLALIGFFGFIIHNTAVNLEQRGIASGFGFLGQASGFDVSMSLIDYEPTSTYGRVLLVGALNTLLVSVLGIIAATFLGVALGILRLSDNWLVGRLVMAYVEVVRNVPLLLQILFWYAVTLNLPKVRQSLVLWDSIVLNNRGIYLPKPLFEPGAGLVFGALGLAIVVALGLRVWARARLNKTGKTFPVLSASLVLIVGLPALVALALGTPWTWDIPRLERFNYRGGFSVIGAFFALWIALSTYTAAFIAEIVRAGIQSVAKGQHEAAAALGLKPDFTMRRVILPQALRVIVPPLTSQYLNLTKNSSLAVAVGYPDIVQVFAGTTLNQTGQAVEVMAITMAFYLTISLLISLGMNIYNRAIALKGANGR